MDIAKEVADLNKELADTEAKIAEGRAAVGTAETRLEHARGVVERVTEASPEKQAERVKEAKKIVSEILKAPKKESPVEGIRANSAEEIQVANNTVKARPTPPAEVEFVEEEVVIETPKTKTDVKEKTKGK